MGGSFGSSKLHCQLMFKALAAMDLQRLSDSSSGVETVMPGGTVNLGEASRDKDCLSTFGGDPERL